MFQVATHFVQSYTTNVTHLLQQQGGKLRQHVTLGSYTGTGAQAVQQIGTTKPVRNLGRYQDTPLFDVPTAERWIVPGEAEWGTMIDNFDKLRMLIDPLGPYTQAGVKAMQRAEDEFILEAFFAAAATGTRGGSSTAFPSGQKVGVNTGGTNSNLNVAKLRAARKLLMAAGVDLDMETPRCIVTSSDHDALLNEEEVKNSDYNTKPVLVDGKISYFMGFQFIHVEFTSTDYNSTVQDQLVSGSTRFLPVWVPSGMHLGTWEGFQASVDKRPDKRNNYQVYMKQTLGATRVEEKRVVQIATIG